MEKTTKNFTVEDLGNSVIELFDEINPIEERDSDKVYALDMCLKAYDDLFVWAGLYKSMEELEYKLDHEYGYCSAWLNYNPTAKTVELEVADQDESYYYINLVGTGVEPLINYIEQYCQKMESKSGQELVDEYNNGRAH